MDKEHLETTPFEYSGHNETRIDQQVNQVKNNNTQGSILFSQKPAKKKKPFKWSRIRSFFITHKQLKRSMEFSVHTTGIHLLHHAVFHSDNGCKMCRVYIEKTSFSVYFQTWLSSSISLKLPFVLFYGKIQKIQIRHINRPRPRSCPIL